MDTRNVRRSRDDDGNDTIDDVLTSPPPPPNRDNRRRLEGLRATVEARIIEDVTADFGAMPVFDDTIDTDDNHIDFALRFLRHMQDPRGPVGHVVEFLTAPYYPTLDAPALTVLADRLTNTDVFSVLDRHVNRLPPSLVNDLRAVAERANYLTNRLLMDARRAATRTGGDGEDLRADTAHTRTPSTRPRDAASALKPGVGESYHGPAAQPPVDVWEYLVAVDAKFDAADAAADIPLNDATKVAHVISLLRGTVLLDFKNAFKTARLSHPDVNKWALHDDALYDFTAFFIDFNTTLDERERAHADYVATKRKGYFTDPGTLARALVRKRSRVGNGKATPSHLRIAAGALLNDYLAMLPPEMVVKIFNDTRFQALNTGSDPDVAGATAASVFPSAVAVLTPNDAPSDKLVIMAFNRAVDIAMVAYKAAISASSAAAPTPRRAALHAFLPADSHVLEDRAATADADDAAPPPPLAAHLAAIESRLAALCESRGGGESVVCPSVDDKDDTAVLASLAQRNYNAVRRQELRSPQAPRPPMKCYKCGKEGHAWRQCPEPGNNFVTPLRRFRQRRGMSPSNDNLTIAKNYVNRNGTLMAIDIDDDDAGLDEDDIVYSSTTAGELFVVA